MNKLKIVFADLDEEYLMPLERKFIDAFSDKVDIIEITDPEYLSRFFHTPQSLDILIINEGLYDPVIEKHNISYTYILTENELGSAQDQVANANKIYKYTSAKEIFNEVVNSSSSSMGASELQDRVTKVITVYSPVGGVGKTTVALGLCEAFSKSHRRTLFIGADNLQTFRFFVDNRPSLKGKIEKQMSMQSEYIYDVLKPLIIVKSFHIMPPFLKALSSLNIKAADYIHLIEIIKRSKDYDYIVVDCATDFSEDTSQLMGFANYNIIVAGQTRYDAYKLDCLAENIDYSDNNRFAFVCNKFRQDFSNIFTSEDYIKKYTIDEYIDYDETLEKLNFDDLSSIKDLRKLALMYI